ncbi:MAG: SEL1-like repeat protein [Gammaproteobacteria bacterium]|nr:SEL1-like repeat protein [Gammaproteobacteria bacterium]
MPKRSLPWQKPWHSMINAFLMRSVTILYVLLVLWQIPAALAQSFEEGKAAYQAKDYQKALEILRPLAEQGNSQAQVTLGIMYDYGHGVTANPEEAFKWYLKAAEQGIPMVQHDVGVKYFQGQGVKQDYLEAARWWEQSANAGLADSQFNLGLMYYRGIGIEQDYRKAAELFLKAANQEHSHAQYSLAVMHAFGQGMDKNYEEALKWFKKSAAQGVAQAQFNLGVFYESGYGLEKDLNTAREWYQRAADQGLEEAKKKLAELTSKEKQEIISRPESISHPEPGELPDKLPDIGIKREDWVIQQNPEFFTLQLSSVLTEKDIVKFIKENNIESEAAYIIVVINGVTRYTALYGVFDTYTEAEKAIKQLPENLQNGKPWVRNFGILQNLLKNS